MHGLSKIMGTSKNRSRRSRNGRRRWFLQPVLPRCSRKSPASYLHNRTSQSKTQRTTHPVHLPARHGWEISLRRPKVCCKLPFRSVNAELYINIDASWMVHPCNKNCYLYRSPAYNFDSRVMWKLSYTIYTRIISTFM